MASDLRFIENIPKGISDRQRIELVTALETLRRDLSPRLSQLSFSERSATLRNLVGSFRLPAGDVVEVLPKVGASGDWSSAVVHLLEPNTRISVTGSRRSKSTPRRHDLTAALALEFARRLEHALKRSGPIEVYERRHFSTRRPNGHLNVSQWVRRAVLDPTLFPISREELSSANGFTEGLSIVAGQLSRSDVGAELASRLRRLQTAVIPGHALPTHVSPTVVRKPLPSQWSKYQPAWDIATALLRNHSIVGDPGRSIGLEVAIEPWPLLETLLSRTLISLSKSGPLHITPKAGHPLLHYPNGEVATRVIPDGALQDEDGRVVATFECKYTSPGPTPKDSHAHQALATAAALGSPTAILVYPGNQPLVEYRVAGTSGHPVKLATIGLSLFDYTKGEGDIKRAAMIREVLERQHSVQR